MTRWWSKFHLDSIMQMLVKQCTFSTFWSTQNRFFKVTIKRIVKRFVFQFPSESFRSHKPLHRPRTSNRRRRSSTIRVGIKWPQKWLLLLSNFYPDELVGTKIQKHSIHAMSKRLEERLVFQGRGIEVPPQNATWRHSAIKSLFLFHQIAPIFTGLQ